MNKRIQILDTIEYVICDILFYIDVKRKSNMTYSARVIFAKIRLNILYGRK